MRIKRFTPNMSLGEMEDIVFQREEAGDNNEVDCLFYKEEVDLWLSMVDPEFLALYGLIGRMRPNRTYRASTAEEELDGGHYVPTRTAQLKIWNNYVSWKIDTPGYTIETVDLGMGTHNMYRIRH